MILFFDMIVTEGDNNLSLTDDNRNQGAFPGVHVLQRDPDVRITAACNKLDRFRFAVNQAVKPLDMCPVAVFTCTDITKDRGTGDRLPFAGGFT